LLVLLTGESRAKGKGNLEKGSKEKRDMGSRFSRLLSDTFRLPSREETEKKESSGVILCPFSKVAAARKGRPLASEISFTMALGKESGFTGAFFSFQNGVEDTADAMGGKRLGRDAGGGL